jgi:hypothetical protein
MWNKYHECKQKKPQIHDLILLPLPKHRQFFASIEFFSEEIFKGKTEGVIFKGNSSEFLIFTCRKKKNYRGFFNLIL